MRRVRLGCLCVLIFVGDAVGGGPTWLAGNHTLQISADDTFNFTMLLRGATFKLHSAGVAVRCGNQKYSTNQEDRSTLDLVRRQGPASQSSGLEKPGKLIITVNPFAYAGVHNK